MLKTRDIVIGRGRRQEVASTCGLLFVPVSEVMKGHFDVLSMEIKRSAQRQWQKRFCTIRVLGEGDANSKPQV